MPSFDFDRLTSDESEVNIINADNSIDDLQARPETIYVVEMLDESEERHVQGLELTTDSVNEVVDVGNEFVAQIFPSNVGHVVNVEYSLSVGDARMSEFVLPVTRTTEVTKAEIPLEYQCSFCEKSFKTKHYLTRHLKLHTDERPYNCNVCGDEFSHLKSLFHHLKTMNHYIPGKSDRISSSFRWNSSEQANDDGNQTAIELTDDAGQCEDRDAVEVINISPPLNADSHQQFLPLPPPPSSPLRESSGSEAEEEPSQSIANVSNFKVKVTEAYKKEFDSFHKYLAEKGVNKYEQDEDKSYVCPFCVKKLKNKRAVRRHLFLSHMAIKPHVCSLCDRGFKTKDNLDRHMRCHTDERPYKCDTCNSAYRDKQQLTRHQRVHTDERPYECRICGNKFRQSNHLKYHLKVHQAKGVHAKTRLLKLNRMET